jgi:hypothetical protein
MGGNVEQGVAHQLDVGAVGHAHVHVAPHAGVFEAPVGDPLADEV